MSEAKYIPKIHFAALVGVDVDSDLLPWWIPHYREMHLDSYTVFLHESLDEEKNNQAEVLLVVLGGFNVRRVSENALRESPAWPGAPDGVRRTILGAFAKSLHPQDFLITADGDEIQEWEENPRDTAARGISVVLGQLIDRFDDSLHDAIPGKSLLESFPIEDENLHRYFRKVSLVSKKICMAPASYPVEYSGSHDLTLGEKFPPRCTVSGTLRVLHFHWRKSAASRVRGRSYWSVEEIATMEKFFQIGIEK